jgi:hypothetical protein
LKSKKWSRRDAVLSMAAILAPFGASRASPAAAPYRFRAIEVDVNPLREGGDVDSAERIARELPPLLQKSFAGHLAPDDRAAPVLRARIDFVTFGMQGSAGGPHSTMAIDFIEGAGVVIGPGGRPAATYPLRCSLAVNVDLNDVTGEMGRLRVTNLEQAFAQWLPGKLGI